MNKQYTDQEQPASESNTSLSGEFRYPYTTHSDLDGIQKVVWRGFTYDIGIPRNNQVDLYQDDILIRTVPIIELQESPPSGWGTPQLPKVDNFPPMPKVKPPKAATKDNKTNKDFWNVPDPICNSDPDDDNSTEASESNFQKPSAINMDSNDEKAKSRFSKHRDFFKKNHCEEEFDIAEEYIDLIKPLLDTILDVVAEDFSPIIKRINNAIIDNQVDNNVRILKRYIKNNLSPRTAIKLLLETHHRATIPNTIKEFTEGYKEGWDILKDYKEAKDKEAKE